MPCFLLLALLACACHASLRPARVIRPEAEARADFMQLREAWLEPPAQSLYASLEPPRYRWAQAAGEILLQAGAPPDGFSELLDDFEAGGAGTDHVNIFFGSMDKWDSAGSQVKWELAPHAGGPGRFMKLSCSGDVGSNGCGTRHRLAPDGRTRDLSRYSHLRFRIRRDRPALNPVGIRLQFTGQDPESLAIGPVTDTWRTVYIPLAQDAVALDRPGAESLAFIFMPGPETAAGELWIDDIAFVSKEPAPVSDADLLALLRDRACRYFLQTADPQNGLFLDRAGRPDRWSVGATGFGLAALCVAARDGLVSQQHSREMAGRCLDTLLSLQRGLPPEACGFLYHFYVGHPAVREAGSETSTIDTSLAIIGAIACGEYFGGDIASLSEQLYAGINWRGMYDAGVKQFRMAWSPEKGATGHWDYYTDEALLIDLLAVGSPKPAFACRADEVMHWRRETGDFGGHTCVKSWFGALFTYGFCNLFVDLRNRTDRHPDTPVDWFANSREAALANQAFCNSLSATYPVGVWGITDCLRPDPGNPDKEDWISFGAAPTGDAAGPHHEGYLSPYGASMCLPFFTGSANPSLDSLWTYWRDYPALWGVYGFRDGMRHAAGQPDWFAHDYVGIAQGPLLLGIVNHESQFIWGLTGSHSRIIAARNSLFTGG